MGSAKKSSSWLGKGLKFAGSKFGGPLIDVGMNTLSNLKAQKGKKNIGKAVGHGLVDSVFSLNPATGAMMGAAFGPGGAAVGAALGLSVSIFKLVRPTISNDIKSRIN